MTIQMDLIITLKRKIKDKGEKSISIKTQKKINKIKAISIYISIILVSFYIRR